MGHDGECNHMSRVQKGGGHRGADSVATGEFPPNRRMCLEGKLTNRFGDTNGALGRATASGDRRWGYPESSHLRRSAIFLRNLINKETEIDTDEAFGPVAEIAVEVRLE